MLSKAFVVVICGVAMCLALPSTAHAYLDPGTGSYVVQLLIAGLLGAAFAVKMFWLRIKEFFARVFSRGGRND